MRSVRQFSGEVDSPAAARHFVRGLLRDQPEGIVEAVELMTSELATNSVRHAHSGFELVLDDSREQIRVEVSDTGRGQPLLRSPTIRERSGRGLRIVQALSDAWGSVPSANGKTVWFTLPTGTHATEREAPSGVSSEEPDDTGDPSVELRGPTAVPPLERPGDGPSAAGRSGDQGRALRCERHADVAQLAERRSCKAEVAGSIPAVGSREPACNPARRRGYRMVWSITARSSDFSRAGTPALVAPIRTRARPPGRIAATAERI